MRPCRSLRAIALSARAGGEHLECGEGARAGKLLAVDLNNMRLQFWSLHFTRKGTDALPGRRKTPFGCLRPIRRLRSLVSSEAYLFFPNILPPWLLQPCSDS